MKAEANVAWWVRLAGIAIAIGASFALLLVGTWRQPARTRSTGESGIIVLPAGQPANQPIARARTSPLPAETGGPSGQVQLQELYIAEEDEYSIATIALQNGEIVTVSPGAILPDGSRVENIGAYGVDLSINGQRVRATQNDAAPARARDRSVDAYAPRMPHDL